MSVRSSSVGWVPTAVGIALWVDPVLHANESRRFDSFVVRGHYERDCDFFTGAIGTDGYGRFYISRGKELCVRPHRYALARSRGALRSHELALHECDNPLCVKISDASASSQHVVVGTQANNMRRMARMRRGGGRKPIAGDGLRVRRERSVALRAVLRERGWDRDAVEAALLGDMPTLW